MILMPGAIVFGDAGSQYEVLDFLGSGNFGTVHKVKARQGEQLLAMKTVPTPFNDEAGLKAFLNEGRLAVGIRHPNVIEYLYFHDGTTYEGLPPYILMEYANGGTLHEELLAAQRENRRFSNDELTGMFRQLVAGMQAINEVLVHRDIKPDNILIRDGTLKISDFGLSKVVVEATRKSTFKGFGCVAYMAPEAWRFEKNTPQLDIYAMGVVFYQLATLRHPFDVKTPDPQKWMEAHMFEPIKRPDHFNRDLAPRLSQVIMKMLEKDSSRRFPDWASIDKLLSGRDLPQPGQKDLVSAMLNRRLEQDTAIQTARAQEQRKNNEWRQLCKLVLSQAENTLLPPIQELVDTFNGSYAGEKASFSGGSSEAALRWHVQFPSRHSVSIEFAVVREDDFIRQVPVEDYGRVFYRQVNQRPRYNERPVQGWGVVKGSDGRGFNVLLVERPNELYGEFLAMCNKTGFLMAHQRVKVEPFAFEFAQLERGVSMINVMNEFHSDVKAFDAAAFAEFVSEYV